MGSDHDIVSRLPAVPAASPEVREAAIAHALHRFDSHASAQAEQGAERGPAPRLASRTSLAAPRVRHLMAASIVVAIAAPAAWLYVGGSRQDVGGHPVEERQAAMRPAAPSEPPALMGIDTGRREPAAMGYAAPPPVALAPAAPAPAAPAQLRAAGRVAAAPAGGHSNTDVCAAPDPERTIGACTRVIEDKAQDARRRALAYASRGAAYVQKGELDRALADYGEAIGLDPDSPIAFHGRALVYRAKGEVDRATADHDRATSLDPSYGAR
jgi:tetratricopeptide (TPR) repeat protein